MIDADRGQNTVFGKKQETARELEEKLNNVQSELEKLQAGLAQIRDYTQQIVPFFEAQIIAQSEMDKGLTKVVSHACDTIESAGESMKALEHIAMELTSLRGQLEDEEKDKKKLREAAKKQKEQIDAIVKANKQMEEPAKRMQEVQGGLAEDAEKVRRELNLMIDYAKQMTVTSLNCAIEAGRMGDTGRKFIAASEEVRVLSSAYERTAVSAASYMDRIDEHISKIEEHAGGLNKSGRETDALMLRVLRTAEDQEAACSRAAERHHLEKAAIISDYLTKISQNHDKMDDLQHQTLSDIEQLGESFMSEQEARKELEHIFEQITKNL